MPIGPNMLKRWSPTQSTMSLSSGEAGSGGIAKGASNGMGFQSMAADLSSEDIICIYSDPSAAMCISRRRGLGPIRHVSVGGDLCARTAAQP